MKQLEEDPWKDVEGKYKIGDVFTGKVSNITDYGAFVELESGIEGLVHVSEMSWTKKNVHPGKIVSATQEVQVKVLEVDSEKRRISLGIKQCSENPWAKFVEENPVGQEIEGEIKNITEFGLFIGLSDEIDGMIHLSDISWEKSGEEAVKNYEKGQKITAKIIDVDVEKERISLGIKQLSEDPYAGAMDDIKKGAIVEAEVVNVNGDNLEVKVGEVSGIIKQSDLAKDKKEQDVARFTAGDKVKAKVATMDKKNRKVTLSIKAMEIEEEKQAISEYSNNESGASLGDILGEALAKKDNK